MALVGQSALATGSTTITPVYAGATAGNLLIAFLSGNQASALGPYTCSDGSWTAIAQEPSLTPFCRSEMWTKIAVGSDTMPTWSNNSTLFECGVIEWSLQTTLDQTGVKTGALSPETVTASGVDGGTGRVIFAMVSERQAAAATETFTWNVNSLGVGTGINTAYNTGTSAAKHINVVYVTTATTGSSADNGVATWNNVSTESALAIASFYQLPLVPLGRKPPVVYEHFDDDPYATFYAIRRHTVLPLNPSIQGPGGSAFDDQQDIFYPGWELFNYLHRHLPADLFPPPTVTPFVPLHHEQTPWEVFEPDPYDQLYATVHRRYFDKTDRIPIRRATTPLDAFGMDQPWDDQVGFYRGRRYLETKGQPPDPRLPFPPHHTPLDSFGMDMPWDDWPLFQRNAMHRQAQFPVPYNFPLRREPTPQDAFGFDSPWDDWVSLYAHRKYVETNVKPADPKLPLPRAKTPPDAFGFDAPWDDYVSLFRQRRYLETKGQKDLKLPTPPHHTPYEVFEDDPYQTWYSNVHRRFITGADFFLPKRAQPFVQIHQWDEWVDLYAQPGPRRTLGIRPPAPQGPGGTAFDDPLDLFYPTWAYWPYLHKHLPGDLFPPPPIPPLPPPPLGPPGKMERTGTKNLHGSQGNQITRQSVAPLHGQQGNQLQRTPVNPLHKQTQ